MVHALHKTEIKCYTVLKNSLCR